MVIITDLDDDNQKTYVYIPREAEEPTPVVNHWQWQQPPRYQQWDLPPRPPVSQQPYPSWTYMMAAGYYGQSNESSGHHQWYPGESSHAPQGDEYHRSQQSQRRSEPIPDPRGHHSHPSNGSVPSSSYGAFEDPYTAFYGPQHQRNRTVFQRSQQDIASTSSTSARDTIFENDEPQQQPFSEFFQGPRGRVSPTSSATTRDTMFGHDQEHLRFGHGNMNGPFQPNTTTANTTAGPSSSRPPTLDIPESSRSRSRPRTSERPVPGPSTSNIPRGSSTPRQATMASTPGTKESLDELLTSELKPIIKKAIASVMGRNNQREGMVLNPTPITIISPEDQGHHAMSPDDQLKGSNQEEEKEEKEANNKTQKKQRSRAELVGIEHISFTDLPDPIMNSIHKFVNNWNGTYQYTLLDRLNGWRVERRQRVTSRYDSYYRHEMSGGFFRSVLEIARFVLREEYPNKRQSNAREQDVHANQELRVNNGANERLNLNLDLNTIPREVEMEDSELNVAQPEHEHNALVQRWEVENHTPQLSPSLQQPRGVLKRKVRRADSEGSSNSGNALEESKRQKQNCLEETPNDLSSEGTIEDLGFCSSNGVNNSVSLPSEAPVATSNDDVVQPPQEMELDSLVSTVARENNSIPQPLPSPTMEVDPVTGAPVGENNSVPLLAPEAPVPRSTSAPGVAASSAADEALDSFMQQLPALEVPLPSGVHDMDFAYGADSVFHEGSELMSHIDPWDNMEDLQNLINMDDGKEPDSDLP